MTTLSSPADNSRRLWPAAMLATALIVSGCGGSSGGSSSSSSSSSVSYNPLSYCEPSEAAENVEWPWVNVASDAPKRLSFSWSSAPGATSYQLYKDTDGSRDYNDPVGSPVTGTSVSEEISVYRQDWANTSYLVEACDDNGVCTPSEEILPEHLQLDAVGYFKPDESVRNLRFGWSTSISADGQTLAIGAPGRTTVVEVENDEGETVEVTRYNVGTVYVFRNTDGVWAQQARLMASNAGNQHRFGHTVALSADGNSLVVGAWRETSNATGVTNIEDEDSVNDAHDSEKPGLYAAGAAYVFEFDGSDWNSTAYLKPFNTNANQNFGYSVAISHDGTRVAVGVPGESNNKTGIDDFEEEPNTNAAASGATYVFVKSGNSWSREAYVKASNTGANDQFGIQVALSGDGLTLAVGAPGESSNAKTIGGAQDNNGALFSGAVYVFNHSDDTWSQQAYIKSSKSLPLDFFGSRLALSGNGDTLAVSAPGEGRNETGINPETEDVRDAPGAGAAFVFVRTGTTWSEEAYIKSSNTAVSQEFGSDLSLSTDGNTLAIGALEERGTGCGTDADQTAQDGVSTGAIYLFDRDDENWAQSRYIKSPTTRDGQRFGQNLSLSGDGESLLVGVHRDGSEATGINGDRFDTSVGPGVGAAFLY